MSKIKLSVRYKVEYYADVEISEEDLKEALSKQSPESILHIVSLDEIAGIDVPEGGKNNSRYVTDSFEVMSFVSDGD